MRNGEPTHSLKPPRLDKHNAHTTSGEGNYFDYTTAVITTWHRYSIHQTKRLLELQIELPASLHPRGF